MRPTALKHAMYFGLMLGLLFCINFFLSTRSSAFCSVASWAIMVLTPYIAYRLTLDCRERVCGGRMSYGEAFLYGMQLFFYAALIGAAFRLLYFIQTLRSRLFATHDRRIAPRDGATRYAAWRGRSGQFATDDVACQYVAQLHLARCAGWHTCVACGGCLCAQKRGCRQQSQNSKIIGDFYKFPVL